MPMRVDPLIATTGIAAAGKPSTMVGTAVIGAVAIAALYFGRDVFVPMALAILLSFALAPPALLLRRFHFGRVPSVVTVVIVAFIAISGIGVCVAGRGPLDEASAAMLAQLLELHGINSRVVSHEAVSATGINELDVADVRMTCICYLEPGSFGNARYLVRRLRRRLPKAAIIAAFWTLTLEQIEQRNALAATGADFVVASTRQAVWQVVTAARASDPEQLSSARI